MSEPTVTLQLADLPEPPADLEAVSAVATRIQPDGGPSRPRVYTLAITFRRAGLDGQSCQATVHLNGGSADADAARLARTCSDLLSQPPHLETLP